MGKLTEMAFGLRKKSFKRMVDASRQMQGLFAEGDAVTRQYSYRYDVSGLWGDMECLDFKFRNPSAGRRKPRGSLA